MSEYLKMYQFLKEEEQLQLQLLEKKERENLKSLRDNKIKLTQQIRSLRKMIGQIETFQNSIIESFEVRILRTLMKKHEVISYFKSYKMHVYLFIYLKTKQTSSGPQIVFLKN